MSVQWGCPQEAHLSHPGDSGIRTQALREGLEGKAGAVTHWFLPQLGSGLAYFGHPEETVEKLNPRDDGYRSTRHRRVRSWMTQHWKRDWVRVDMWRANLPTPFPHTSNHCQPATHLLLLYAMDQWTTPFSKETVRTQRKDPGKQALPPPPARTNPLVFLPPPNEAQLYLSTQNFQWDFLSTPLELWTDM